MPSSTQLVAHVGKGCLSCYGYEAESVMMGRACLQEPWVLCIRFFMTAVCATAVLRIGPLPITDSPASGSSPSVYVFGNALAASVYVLGDALAGHVAIQQAHTHRHGSIRVDSVLPPTASQVQARQLFGQVWRPHPPPSSSFGRHLCRSSQ